MNKIVKYQNSLLDLSVWSKEQPAADLRLSSFQLKTLFARVLDGLDAVAAGVDSVGGVDAMKITVCFYFLEK